MVTIWHAARDNERVQCGGWKVVGLLQQWGWDVEGHFAVWGQILLSRKGMPPSPWTRNWWKQQQIAPSSVAVLLQALAPPAQIPLALAVIKEAGLWRLVSSLEPSKTFLTISAYSSFPSLVPYMVYHPPLVYTPHPSLRPRLPWPLSNCLISCESADCFASWALWYQEVWYKLFGSLWYDLLWTVPGRVGLQEPGQSVAILL